MGSESAALKNFKRRFPASYFSSTNASRVQEDEEMEGSTCVD
jgi:hypothetical protein